VAQERQGRRQVNQGDGGLVFLCDPVCGDEGKLYVTQAVLDGYKEALGVADIATPNGFEAQTLSGITIQSVADARRAAQWFLETFPRLDVVVIKSFADAKVDPDQQSIFLFAVSRSLGQQVHVQVPRIEGYFTGTGDLFAAMFLVNWVAEKDLTAAVVRSCSCLHDVIALTKAKGSKELLVVQGRQFLEQRYGVDMSNNQLLKWSTEAT
jgi:pyridoxine kinase